MLDELLKAGVDVLSKLSCTLPVPGVCKHEYSCVLSVCFGPQQAFVQAREQHVCVLGGNIPAVKLAEEERCSEKWRGGGASTKASTKS